MIGHRGGRRRDGFFGDGINGDAAPVFVGVVGGAPGLRGESGRGESVPGVIDVALDGEGDTDPMAWAHEEMAADEFGAIGGGALMGHGRPFFLVSRRIALRDGRGVSAEAD